LAAAHYGGNGSGNGSIARLAGEVYGMKPNNRKDRKMRLQEENALIQQIARRAEAMFDARTIEVGWQFIASELRIVHYEICRLRLKELLTADDANFLHDICGIHEHIDILDGGFRNGFSPRYASSKVTQLRRIPQ
jgi:hypothetical protein